MAHTYDNFGTISDEKINNHEYNNFSSAVVKQPISLRMFNIEFNLKHVWQKLNTSLENAFNNEKCRPGLESICSRVTYNFKFDNSQAFSILIYPSSTH